MKKIANIKLLPVVAALFLTVSCDDNDSNVTYISKALRTWNLLSNRVLYRY